MDSFTEETLLKFALEETTSSDLIDWAIKMLQSNVETDEILELAGLSYQTRFIDVSEAFKDALKSLGVDISDMNQVVSEKCKLIAVKIVQGEMSPTKGLRYLAGFEEKIRLGDLDIDVDLSDFDTLQDAIWMINSGDDAYKGIYKNLSTGDNEQLIITEAELFLKQLRLEIESSEYEFAYCDSCGLKMKPNKIQIKQPFLKRIFRKTPKICKSVCSKCGSEEVTYIGTQEGRKRYYEELELTGLVGDE